MADRKLTLFEVHLDDATFTANATATDDGEAALSTDGAVDDEYDDGETTDGGCPARRAGRVLLVIAAFAAVALGVKRLLGGDDDLADLAALDET